MSNRSNNLIFIILTFAIVMVLFINMFMNESGTGLTVKGTISAGKGGTSANGHAGSAGTICGLTGSSNIGTGTNGSQTDNGVGGPGGQANCASSIVNDSIVGRNGSSAPYGQVSSGESGESICGLTGSSNIGNGVGGTGGQATC
jgi:hypothetical protein